MPPTKKCVRKLGIWYTLIGEFRWKKIAQALGISHGSVSTILYDRLGMRKPTAQNSLVMSKWQPEHQYAVPC